MFTIRGAYGPNNSHYVPQSHAKFSKAIQSFHLLQLFSLCCSVLLLLVHFQSMWEGLQYVMSLRGSEEYVGIPNSVVWFFFFHFWSTSSNSSSHSTFFFLVQHLPLFLCLFSSTPTVPPLPTTVVEISRNERKAPAWMERFIIFSSHLANCPVSVHIWSVDNWISPYPKDLLTFSQKTFEILLRSSLL